MNSTEQNSSLFDLEDDWQPEIKKKDSILNKVVLNFTSKLLFYEFIIINNLQDKSIKKKNMIEDKFEDEIFKNIQKSQTEKDPSNLNQSYDSDENNENLMFDKAQIKENMKKHLIEENFYDPLLDSKEEEWTNKFMSKFF